MVVQIKWQVADKPRHSRVGILRMVFAPSRRLAQLAFQADRVFDQAVHERTRGAGIDGLRYPQITHEADGVKEHKKKPT